MNRPLLTLGIACINRGMALTPEQKNRIEQNRRRALERLQKTRNKGAPGHSNSGTLHPPAPTSSNPKSTGQGSTSFLVSDVRIRNETPQNTLSNGGKNRFTPAPIDKKDYIEYDLSTLKDTRGGFIDNSEATVGLLGEKASLEEWQEKQKRENLVKDQAPPLDLQNAPKCRECQSIETDSNFMTNFNVVVCRQCIKASPEKYSLLTKTECREDYLLTEPELRDTGILHRIEKPNPHGFLRMQLFLRLEVEEFAWKKWGSPEGLDAEWERREKARLDRKEKRFQAKMREMRKKTRAEEYTRKLRNGMSIGDKHEHSWSIPVAALTLSNVVSKRCIDCGLEIEEINI